MAGSHPLTPSLESGFQVTSAKAAVEYMGFPNTWRKTDGFNYCYVALHTCILSHSFSSPLSPACFHGPDKQFLALLLVDPGAVCVFGDYGSYVAQQPAEMPLPLSPQPQPATFPSRSLLSPTSSPLFLCPALKHLLVPDTL